MDKEEIISKDMSEKTAIEPSPRPSSPHRPVPTPFSPPVKPSQGPTPTEPFPRPSYCPQVRYHTPGTAHRAVLTPRTAHRAVPTPLAPPTGPSLRPSHPTEPSPRPSHRPQNRSHDPGTDPRVELRQLTREQTTSARTAGGGGGGPCPGDGGRVITSAINQSAPLLVYLHLQS